MSDTDYLFDKYASKAGSDQIASRLALRILSELLEKYNPATILEIGSGIGTMTELILNKSPNSKIICYEKNAWCVTQLKKNVDLSNAKILTSEIHLQSINKLELIIIDDFVEKEILFTLIEKTQPSIVFIEGHRRRQRLHVAETFIRLKLNFTLRNYRKDKNSKKGGCVIFVDKNSKYQKYLWYFYLHAALIYAKAQELRAKIHFRKYLGISAK